MHVAGDNIDDAAKRGCHLCVLRTGATPNVDTDALSVLLTETFYKWSVY